MGASNDVSLISPAADEEVAAFFEACPASFAQQTIGWRNVIAPIGPDVPLFLGSRRNNRLLGVLPAYKYDGPLGSILTTCPQAGALGGVACLPNENAPAIYQALLGAFVELAKEKGCATATVITNPFWPDHELYQRFFAADFSLQNSCQVLDLETGVTATGEFPQADTNVLRNLKKAQGGELVMDEGQSEPNVAEWYEIHAARHTEIGATPLPREMFMGALREMVPRDKARFFFVRLKEAPHTMVAGGFYVYHGQVIDALMPSIRTEFSKLSPNFLMAAHTIRWAKARGLRYYNWQASPPGSGVYRFKKQWGSRDATYYICTKVTGDISPFTSTTVAFVREAYRWHYVMPFDRIGVAPGGGPAESSREGAWQALAGAES
ncbi:MAG TPA: GNAT family N-acetyltransferase [Phycisphaerae bacterium]|nr:GNAT family N-acetyltransferase [Phycisphaerae bacterium]